MSKEVKRYDYGYVDDGNGNRYLGLIEKPDGNLVKHEDYKALLAERDGLKEALDEALSALDYVGRLSSGVSDYASTKSRGNRCT